MSQHQGDNQQTKNQTDLPPFQHAIPPARDQEKLQYSINSDPRSSGLIKALLPSGRTKGNSATPAPSFISPTTNRIYQPRIDNMRSGSHSHSSPHTLNMTPYNTRFDSSSQGQAVHNHNGSASAHGSSQASSIVFTNREMSPGNGYFHFSRRQDKVTQSSLPNKSISLAELSQQFQQALAEVRTKISRESGIPTNTQTFLMSEIHRICREFNDAQQTLQLEFDKAENEKIRVYDQLDGATRQLKDAIADRDQYCKERDALRTTVDELRLKAAKTTEKLGNIDSHWKRVNQDLREKLKIKEEQLSGKRALWMDKNPGPSARRAAMEEALRDPFISPSADTGAGSSNSYVDTVDSLLRSLRNSISAEKPTPELPFNAPRGPRRRPNLPTTRAHQAIILSDGSCSFGSSRIFNTEASDTPPATSSTSMALVLHTSDDDPVPEYQSEFSRIYSLVEGWVRIYANIPNLANDQKVARSNNSLWDYMMNCTYPGPNHRQDAHTHVMALLNDVNTRYWFVMRMAVTYLVKDITSIDAWYKFSPETDTIFQDVKKKLQERGLANEARQKLVDQQATAVKSIIASPKYQEFRSNELIYHSKRLRNMLGALLNQGAIRSEAGRDLGALVINSWELSVKMYTSQLTFQVYFPDTAAKFNASTMLAKDQPQSDPMQLQIKQVRLKLVITPVITMRDDRGTTIKAKNLHHSTVLTMG